MDRSQDRPAFPACNEANVNGTMGMTLRQWYAGQALQGFLADGSQRLVAHALELDDNFNIIQDTNAKASVANTLIAEGCFALADAMIAESEKG